MTQNKLTMNLFGFIRLEATQHHNHNWKVVLSNRQSNTSNEISRSVSSEELKMLLDYSVNYLNGLPQQNPAGDAKNLRKNLKLIIKTHRHANETQVSELSPSA